MGSSYFEIVVKKIFVRYYIDQKSTIFLNILMLNKIYRNLELLLEIGQRIAFQ